MILISFDLESVFSCLEGFPELSFQDGEYGFDLVSLMIFFLIERLSDSSSIVSGNPFPFSVSYGDEGAGVEGTHRINSWISSES